MSHSNLDPLFGFCAGCGELCALAGEGLSLCCREKLTNVQTDHEHEAERQIEKERQEYERAEALHDAWLHDGYDRAGDR